MKESTPIHNTQDTIYKIRSIKSETDILKSIKDYTNIKEDHKKL